MAKARVKPSAISTGVLSRDEIRRRLETEPQPANTAIIVPEYLSEEDADKFKLLAIWLCNVGIWDAIDFEELARYVNAEKVYEAAQLELEAALEKGDLDAAESLHRMQDRAFKQCQACEKVLGIGAINRCRIRLDMLHGDEEAKKDGPPLV